MINYIEYKSPEWFLFRKDKIGASEASAVMGLSKFQTNVDLWELKTGLKEPKDLSKNELVNYGINAEEYLAKLFELDFPQYTVVNSKEIVLSSEEYPFIIASPDGLLVDNRTQEKGFVEFKTTTDKGGNAKDEWAVDHIPNGHYCQMLHTFLADKDLSFGIIKCQIKYVTENGENCYCETKHRKIYRKDIKDDLQILLEEEIKFIEYVKRKERPPFKLQAL